MKKGQEEHWNEHSIKDAKRLHNEAYFAGFHHGRHKERDMLVKSGYLQIRPEKMEELKSVMNNPCAGCVNRTEDLKIGCLIDPKKCPLKQKQLDAIEIFTYFS